MTQLAKIEEGEVIDSPSKPLNIQQWVDQRSEFKAKVGSIMVQGIDYSIIKDKKSLGKAGAEKIASIFNWAAEFVKDTDTWEMLGKPEGTLCYICKLTDRKTGAFVGEGRGTRSVDKDGGDTNKSVKMATKSSHIDATIRASGLSDIFTQDLEDMPPQNIQTGYEYTAQPGHTKDATPKQKAFIKKLIKVKGVSGLSSLGFEDKPLTIDYAKQIIEKLLTLPDVDGADLGEPLEVETIQIDKSDLPN